MNREEALQKLEELRQQFTELRKKTTAARVEPVESRIRSLCRSTAMADAIIDSPESAFEALLSEEEEVRLAALMSLDFLWKVEPQHSRSHLLRLVSQEQSPRVMKLVLSMVFRRFQSDQDLEFLQMVSKPGLAPEERDVLLQILQRQGCLSRF